MPLEPFVDGDHLDFPVQALGCDLANGVMVRDRRKEDRAFTLDKAVPGRQAGLGCTDVGIAVVDPALDVFHMLNVLGCVEQQLGIEARIAVVVRGHGNIVGHRKLLEVDPGRRGVGVGAVNARVLDGDKRLSKAFPGQRSFFDAGGGEHVFVVVVDRGGRVERHREQLTRSGGVVVRDPGEVVRPIDFDVVVGHHLLDGVEFARQHQVGGACVKGLHDGRVLVRPKGCDGVLHGGFVAVLADADDFILGLAGVKAVAGFLHHVAQVAGQAVPIFKRGLGRSGAGHAGGREQRKCRDFDVHGSAPRS